MQVQTGSNTTHSYHFFLFQWAFAAAAATIMAGEGTSFSGLKYEGRPVVDCHECAILTMQVKLRALLG